jgi:hypothetical protein
MLSSRRVLHTRAAEPLRLFMECFWGVAGVVVMCVVWFAYPSDRMALSGTRSVRGIKIV